MTSAKYPAPITLGPLSAEKPHTLLTENFVSFTLVKSIKFYSFVIKKGRMFCSKEEKYAEIRQMGESNDRKIFLLVREMRLEQIPVLGLWSVHPDEGLHVIELTKDVPFEFLSTYSKYVPLLRRHLRLLSLRRV